MISNFFGSTIKQTIAALQGPKAGANRHSKNEQLTKIEAITRIILSFILLAIAVYLIKTNNQSDKALPGVIIGGVIGYWFR